MGKEDVKQRMMMNHKRVYQTSTEITSIRTRDTPYWGICRFQISTGLRKNQIWWFRGVSPTKGWFGNLKKNISRLWRECAKEHTCRISSWPVERRRRKIGVFEGGFAPKGVKVGKLKSSVDVVWNVHAKFQVDPLKNYLVQLGKLKWGFSPPGRREGWGISN